ncbi:MAG: hypothetical protein IKB33_05390 [Spirochaetaceae bacterium]|nr:hypothetical protein [Spirochaetaceae bacterium]
MRKRFLLLPVVAGFLLGSCTTMGDYDYSAIDRSLESQGYQAAYEQVVDDSRKMYSSHDEVLLHLDRGMLSHYAGEFERSNQELAEAERKIEEYYAKSVTQAISAYLVNDTVVDYSGEVFEDIYTNIFMALNYIQLGDVEGAFVEIRRFDNKLRAASAKYSDMISQANKESGSNGGETIEVPDMEFHNSALARYLSMILYRSRGQLDSASIDMRYLNSAFASQPDIYNFPVPSSLAQELEIPEGKARLNVMAFSGLAPVKEEEEERLFSISGDFYYKIAYPRMQSRDSAVKSIKVTVIPLQDESGQMMAATSRSVSMEPLESISNIALDTFAQHQALIYLRAMVRSITKAVSTAVWGGLADNTSDVGLGLLFSVAQLASTVATEATERADVRCTRFLPGFAWVTGVWLDPGSYRIVIEYKNSSGQVVSQEEQTVSVRSNGLNLVESLCLR